MRCATGWARPTPYGLGKSGWVSADFPAGVACAARGGIAEWIDESYRALAPEEAGGGAAR